MKNKNNKNNIAEFNLLQGGKGYLEDFISEIVEILEDTELELVNLQMDPENKDCINSIYYNFNAIKGLSGLIDKPLCNKTAVLTEELLDIVRKNNVPVSRNIINYVLDSVKIIRKFCTETTVETNEAETHIQNLAMSVKTLLKDYQETDFEEDIFYRKDPLNEPALREKETDAQDIIKGIRMHKIRNIQSSDQYVKIPLEKLDQIIDIIQKVEKIHSSVKNEAALRFGSNDSLTVESTRSYYLINDVKNILKELRMVTFQQAFQKLTRSVCSFIEENHLEVKFSTMGENVEADKEFADKIATPLGELIKLVLSKSDTGPKNNRTNNVEVLAYEENGLVHIDIISDMALDPAELKRDPGYTEVLEKLNSLSCRTTLEYDPEGRIKLSVTSTK